MTVSRDVMILVGILEEEGFGALAGEMLTEITLGREVSSAPRPQTRDRDLDDHRDEARPKREPIPEDQQLAVALEIVRLRIVEPVRRLAEAERIAGDLAPRPVVATVEPAAERKRVVPVRIEFVNAEGDAASGFGRSGVAGDDREAQELGELLGRIAEESR